MDKQWYAIYTKLRAEKKVSEILTRKKIENFLPLNKIVTDRIINKKVIKEPLFSRYIFIRLTKLQLSELKKFPDIISMVYWLGKPVIIDDQEISMIQNFLNAHLNVTIKKTTLLNDTSKKYDSSVVEQEGLGITVKNKRANIILPSLGYMLTAEPETSNVRIISSSNLIPRSKLPAKFFNTVSFNNLFKN